MAGKLEQEVHGRTCCALIGDEKSACDTTRREGGVVTLIWAMDRNRLIGDRHRLPWPHIPADMRWFRRRTMGKPVVMGRVTFDSIGGPLPGRRNIVLSRGTGRIEGVEQVSCLEALRDLFAAAPETEWMVIGGATLYRQLLPEADRLCWTEIDHVFHGDTWFPPFDAEAWQRRLIATVPLGADSPFPLRFYEATPSARMPPTGNRPKSR